ncbi:MAG TPA: Sec-independent protein translocase protein TatB [Magnetospirillaceae bacterium]|jgi:sec-independent protein translocase protein TatB
MLGFAWSEIALIGAVALVVIGPKDLPRVMRTLGQWSRKLRMLASDFQRQFDDMVKEAELDDLKQQAEKAMDVSDIKSDIEKAVDVSDIKADVEKSVSLHEADAAADLPVMKPIETPPPQPPAEAPPADPAVGEHTESHAAKPTEPTDAPAREHTP